MRGAFCWKYFSFLLLLYKHVKRHVLTLYLNYMNLSGTVNWVEMARKLCNCPPLRRGST